MSWIENIKIEGCSLSVENGVQVIRAWNSEEIAGIFARIADLENENEALRYTISELRASDPERLSKDATAGEGGTK